MRRTLPCVAKGSAWSSNGGCGPIPLTGGGPRRRACRAAEVSRATQLLVDARNMRLVLVDDERWWSEVMLPRLTTTEIRWIAVVVPVNQLAEVSVGEMAETRRRDGAESRHFRTIDEARAWLSSKGTPSR